MPAAPPKSSWNALFNNLKEQGDSLDQPISPSNTYYAFLSKVDLDLTTNLYDILFEVMPKEWADNAVFAGSVSVKAMAPVPPASLYHIPTVTESAILSVLGLKSADQLAEGSWYEIEIAKSEDDPVLGHLYDPNLGMEPNI